MNKTCLIADERQLICEDITVTCTASSTVSGQYTLTTDRGDVQGVQIYGSANAFDVTVNLQINSTTVLKNANLGTFTPETTAKYTPVSWKQASIINYTAVNSGGTNHTMVIRLWYVNPIL